MGGLGVGASGRLEVVFDFMLAAHPIERHVHQL